MSKVTIELTGGDIEPAVEGRPGTALVSLVISGGKRSVEAKVMARTDQVGPTVTLDLSGKPRWIGGVEWVALRWTTGPTADLILDWPESDKPAHAGPHYALVSDALLLARDEMAQWAVRAFWGALPSLGRPSEQTERIAAIVAEAAALGDAATVDTVAASLGRVSRDGYGGFVRPGDYNRDVAAAGGWPEIMRRARSL